MNWSELQPNGGDSNNSNTVICWFPGWSFQPQVFAPLYQALPGNHLGACFCGQGTLIDNARQLADELVQQLQQRLPQVQRLLFIGWSLGGALAVHCLQQLPPHWQKNTGLITLATGRRFLQAIDNSAAAAEPIPGMAADTFNGFSSDLQQAPEKTRQRFAALCARHSQQPRPLMRQLSQQQIRDPAILNHSLGWLNYPELSSTARVQQHCYASRDDFNPAALSPAFYAAAASHSFFLTAAGQRQILQQIQRMLEQLQVPPEQQRGETL